MLNKLLIALFASAFALGAYAQAPKAEPKTEDYGEDYWVDRGYEAVDPEGHHWFFIQRLKDGKKKS